MEEVSLCEAISLRLPVAGGKQMGWVIGRQMPSMPRPLVLVLFLCVQVARS